MKWLMDVKSLFGSLVDHVPSGATIYSSDGALLQKPGLSTIAKTSICTLTLDAPTESGITMVIIATTAFKHVIICASGFNGGTSTTATFGGLAGDNITLVSMGDTWIVTASTNVTLL